jgi:pseudouridine-5'-phosphate glycosidase
LETQGVTVASYQTSEFPAFFTSKSGCKSHCQLNDPLSCAKLVHANHELGLNSGMLVAVPIPSSTEAKSDKINEAIQKSLSEAK